MCLIKLHCICNDYVIFILHAVSSDNANALEDIINYAKNEGYTFKSLDEGANLRKNIKTLKKTLY